MLQMLCISSKDTIPNYQFLDSNRIDNTSNRSLYDRNLCYAGMVNLV